MFLGQRVQSEWRSCESLRFEGISGDINKNDRLLSPTRTFIHRIECKSVAVQPFFGPIVFVPPFCAHSRRYRTAKIAQRVTDTPIQFVLLSDPAFQSPQHCSGRYQMASIRGI